MILLPCSAGNTGCNISPCHMEDFSDVPGCDSDKNIREQLKEDHVQNAE